MPLKTPVDLTRAAMGVGLSLTPDEAERLVAYAQLLQRWNQRINLTASRTLADILERQVLDALMADLLPWPGTVLHVVDIGSGAGLPGLLIALRHPAFFVTTLERVGKKASFQQEDGAQHAAGVGHQRYDAALARAFADLAHTLPLAARLLRPGGLLRTFKGRKLPEELAAIPPDVRKLFRDEVVQHPYAVPETQVAGVLVQFQRI